MIEIKNCSKNFISGKRQVHALKEINLEIAKGKFIALVGPSGSGKSTLLNLIGGLDTVTSGEILINHKKISGLNDKQMSEFRSHTIGFIFQEFHLEPFLTVKENILLPTHFTSKNKNAEKYAEELLDEVGLSEKKNSLITELSGGQKQRTALARALINHPKILLADEPTGNLDQKTGTIIINLLKKLQKTHKTTLIIATHDAEIAKSAQKIIHIKDGKIS